MFVQLSGVIGANRESCASLQLEMTSSFSLPARFSDFYSQPAVYQANDRPRYVKANSGIIAVIAFNLIIV